MSEYIKFRGAVYILAKHMDIKVVRASWSRLVRFIQSTVPEIWKTAELLARHKSQFLSDLALLDTWLTGRHHNPAFPARQYDKLSSGSMMTFYMSDGSTWLTVDLIEGKFRWIDLTPLARQRLDQITARALMASAEEENYEP